MGFFGGLFVLLGLISLVLFPGLWSLVGIFGCLVPGISMLIPVVIWARNRSRSPAAAGELGDSATEQGAPQETQGKQDAQTTGQVQKEIAAVPVVPSQVIELVQPQGSALNPDPSYYRERAIGYRRRIQSIIRNRRPGPLADMMASVVVNLQQWEDRVAQLVDRLTMFERDMIIQRDIKEVPASIVRLRDRIETEPDAGIREQMARTLTGYESQQAMLDTLVRLMRRTRLLLDDTLIAMGTIYSQVRVIEAIDIDSAQTSRIAEELDEQVKRLSDLLAAMGDASPGLKRTDDLGDEARRIRMQPGSSAGA